MATDPPVHEPPTPPGSGFRRRRASDDAAGREQEQQAQQEEQPLPSLPAPTATHAATVEQQPSPRQDEEKEEEVVVEAMATDAGQPPRSKEQKGFIKIRSSVVARSLEEGLAALKDVNCVELEFTHHVSLSDPKVDSLQV